MKKMALACQWSAKNKDFSLICSKDVCVHVGVCTSAFMSVCERAHVIQDRAEAGNWKEY